MADNNNPQDFAEKVLQSLKKQSRAVDLTDKNVEKNVEENVVEQANVQPLSPVEPVSQDFTAFGQPSGGGLGPASGGNKDLVVIDVQQIVLLQFADQTCIGGTLNTYGLMLRHCTGTAVVVQHLEQAS
jgi:hypothetical protein